MPFNGSGVFQRVRNWVADAAAGIKIRADYHDSEDDGFALGLSNCIAKDGQTTITQNIPFNSKRITGLANPINPQDAATKASGEAYTNTKVTTLPPPANGGDATNKTYVDAGDAAANAAAAAAQATANAAQTAASNADANANNRVSRGGDTMAGLLRTVASTAGIGGGTFMDTLEVTGDVNNAGITFHRVGSFAANFGLAADGNLWYGGASFGAGVNYKIWTTRDFASPPLATAVFEARIAELVTRIETLEAKGSA